jgi:hypothetical protein
MVRTRCIAWPHERQKWSDLMCSRSISCNASFSTGPLIKRAHKSAHARWVGGLPATSPSRLMAMVPYARPQDADRGQIEFLLNCASCRGTDGPESAKLHIKPVDLTVLAKRNHGRFDPGAVYQMIDGRNARLSHHSTEMPIWGCRHQTPLPNLPTTTQRKHKIPKRILSQMSRHDNELDSLLDLPCASEAATRERLLAIVSYLSLVQEK